MAGEIEKMGNGQVAAILESGGYILAVTMLDKDGNPVVIGGGESGGSVQLKQGESDVSSTNPLPIGLLIKNQMGNWVTVSPFNPVTVRDIAIAGALVNQGSDPNSGQMMLIAGAGVGGTRAIPVNLQGSDDTMTLVPIGGVDENGKQKTLNFHGDRAKVELQNVTGPLSEANPLDTQNATIGKKDDAAATSDTATSSLISLFKRLLGKFPALSGGRMPVETVKKEAFLDNGAFQSFAINTNLLTGTTGWFDATGYSSMSFDITGDANASYQIRVLMTNDINSANATSRVPYLSDLSDPSLAPNTNDIYVFANSNKSFEFIASMRYVKLVVMATPTGNVRVAGRFSPSPWASMRNWLPRPVRVSEITATSSNPMTLTHYYLSSDGTNPTLVTNITTRLLHICASNKSATSYWLKIYNRSTTSGLASFTPDFSILLEAGKTTPINLGDYGRYFNTGIVFQITQQPQNSSTDGCLAGEVVVNLMRA